MNIRSAHIHIERTGSMLHVFIGEDFAYFTSLLDPDMSCGGDKDALAAIREEIKRLEDSTSWNSNTSN